MEHESYRDRFRRPEDAENYQANVYQRGTVSDLLWQVEKPLLGQIAAHQRARVGEMHYLDFACGTGRILSFVEPYAASATGIDISSSMLELAASKTQARLICCDISVESGGIVDKYDLVTSFRFFSNAERSLRRAVLAELAGFLRDKDSLLVINIHANPWSYRAVMIPYYWLKEKLTGVPMLPYLTRRRMLREIRAVGLEVQSVIGMGFVAGRLVPLLPFRLSLAVERKLAGAPLIQRFGVNQLFLCRNPRRPNRPIPQDMHTA